MSRIGSDRTALCGIAAFPRANGVDSRAITAVPVFAGTVTRTFRGSSPAALTS